MTSIHYDLIDGGKSGRLLSPLWFNTPITGHEVPVGRAHNVSLDEFGGMRLHTGFTWDFGSYALDTPAMVRASAAHDALCYLTDAGILPWKCRAQADQYFRETLKANGVGFARRWWCWTGVRTYSKTVAYWNRQR